jgi:hypothetical protein
MASGDRPSTARKARTKSPKARATDDDKEQSARFIETARQLDSDESGSAFDKAIDSMLRPTHLPK